MSRLFIYQGEVTCEDICRALSIEDEDELDVENEVVFNFLLRYVDEEGM